jgi:Protein of unknown function (DUF3313)
MKRRHATAAVGALALAAGVLLLQACATSQGPAPSWDGLELREQKKLDAVYVKPNVTFAAYKQVILDPVTVKFSENWDPNRNSAQRIQQFSKDDIEAIRTGIADEFHKVFEKVLTEGGYKLTQEAGPEVLHVGAALIDIYITAPDAMTAGRSRTYTTDSGRVTLVMEMVDSITGETLARVVDKEEGSGIETWQWTNKVTNVADLDAALKKWAMALRAGLDKVNGKQT